MALRRAARQRYRDRDARRYREIARPTRFVHTQTFDLEDFPGELLVSTDLAEMQGGTTLTSTILYPSQELRDGDVDATEHGTTESYAKLDEFLERHGDKIMS